MEERKVGRIPFVPPSILWSKNMEAELLGFTVFNPTYRSDKDLLDLPIQQEQSGPFSLHILKRCILLLKLA